MRQLLSLRHWTLAIIVLPTILIGVLLGGFLTYKRYVELEQNLVDRGIYLSEPLTLFASQALIEQQTELLSHGLDSAHIKASPFVRSITVFLPDHSLHLSSNIHTDFTDVRIAPGKLLPSHTSVDKGPNYIYVRSPIISNLAKQGVQYVRQQDGRYLYGYLVVELSRERALLAQQSSILSVAALFLIAIAVLVVLAVVFVRYVFNPVDQISRAINKIAAGDTKVRVSNVMRGELEALRNSVNSVAKSVYLANERAEHNISEYTQELQQTVEQLEVQNIQLNMAKRDAQNANNVKSQFLANMSHELRTPLNGVLGFTRQLRKTPLNINQSDFLDTIESSANNLLRIINDILDFSKLDADKMELEAIPFSLRDSVNDVMTLLAPGIFDKGLEVHLNIDNRVPDELLGDPVRLKQIMVNLIGNATKFTKDGFVRLDVNYIGSHQEGHHIKFTITDTGIGIDEGGKQKLFGAFGQADSSTTRKYGGTGLGLIICKKLIEAMGGDIHFTSELDKGSAFTFDCFIKENSSEVGQPIPIELIDGKNILYFDTCSQAYNDIQQLLTNSTGAIVTGCEDEASFYSTLAESEYDIVLIGRKVAPSTIGELKKLVVKATEHCQQVYAIINSISPNLKEAIIGSGARACFSMPLNHRKVFGTILEPYIEPEEELPVQGTNFRGMRVLAVDDMEANLKLLSSLLIEMNVDCDLAADGAEALSKAQKLKYDLIFMDIQMPIMDGITACQRIKNSSLNEDTPIVSVTAHAGVEEQKQMETVGFNGFLAKPIDEEMLTQVILDTCPGCSITGVNEDQDKPNETQSAPAIAEYHHLDWPLALSRAAGKEELAIEMFTMLVKSIPDSLQSIELNHDEQNVEELIKAVHKFHGACCYTGVPKLKNLAEMIEGGLKKHKSIEQVEPELLELIDQMTAMIEELKDWSV